MPSFLYRLNNKEYKYAKAESCIIVYNSLFEQVTFVYG